jgi:hypothetical protein
MMGYRCRLVESEVKEKFGTEQIKNDTVEDLGEVEVKR